MEDLRIDFIIHSVTVGAELMTQKVLSDPKLSDEKKEIILEWLGKAKGQRQGLIDALREQNPEGNVQIILELTLALNELEKALAPFVMTKETAIDLLGKVDRRDPEASDHEIMKILRRFLERNGYPDVAKAF